MEKRETVSGRVFTIGNVTYDTTIHPNNDIIESYGGTLYGAITAKRLGYESHLKTMVGDFNFEYLKSNDYGLEIHCDYDEGNTIFVNDYSSGERKQKIIDKTGKIDADRFDAALSLYGNFDMIFLDPMFHEIGVEIVEVARKYCKILSLDVQGLVRNADKHTGDISIDFLEDRVKYLYCLDILKVGHDEIGGISKLDGKREVCEELYSLGSDIILLTDGAKGSLVYDGIKGEFHEIPSFPVNVVVDETGAGDVYTTAFGIKYFEILNPLDAGLFATAAASFVVEGYGPESIAARKKVEERYMILKKTSG